MNRTETQARSSARESGARFASNRRLQTLKARQETKTNADAKIPAKMRKKGMVVAAR
jgi:hypothetical protein